MTKSNESVRNREDMTFTEWLAASGLEIGGYCTPALRKAWRDGEDPTEYGNEFRKVPVYTSNDQLPT